MVLRRRKLFLTHPPDTIASFGALIHRIFDNIFIGVEM